MISISLLFVSSAFALQEPETAQVMQMFVDEVEGEVGAWDWPTGEKDAFRYNTVIYEYTFQVLVTYFLRDGGARLERADVVVDIRILNKENYKHVANVVIESVYKLFKKAKAMEERGELAATDSFITLTEQERELWKKFLSTGQSMYPEKRDKFLNLNSDFVRINQIYGFFEGKRMIKVIVVVADGQGFEEFHSVFNIYFDELAMSSNEDFINIVRRAHEAVDSFLRARKLKIAD